MSNRQEHSTPSASSAAACPIRPITPLTLDYSLRLVPFTTPCRATCCMRSSAEDQTRETPIGCHPQDPPNDYVRHQMAEDAKTPLRTLVYEITENVVIELSKKAASPIPTTSYGRKHPEELQAQASYTIWLQATPGIFGLGCSQRGCTHFMVWTSQSGELPNS